MVKANGRHFPLRAHCTLRKINCRRWRSSRIYDHNEQLASSPNSLHLNVVVARVNLRSQNSEVVEGAHKKNQTLVPAQKLAHLNFLDVKMCHEQQRWAGFCAPLVAGGFLVK